MKILFVCTGNTCRSPMAEALAQNFLADKGSFQCDSAGIYAVPGQKIAANAVEILKEYGIQNFQHEAKKCTKEMIDENDLIITVTENHRALLCQLFGNEQKIRTLPENVGDPFGGDLNTYRATSNAILSGIKKLFEEGLFNA
ncbi:MAG: low molecular weight protein arginine phosphatase [Clostridia bacterium]|nr:low molecular weight protein arginine phosphatase [Clostridia bacterium]